MPFTPRPDSWLILSGSTDRRNEAAAATNSHYPLSEFIAEKSPQVILAPRASTPARADRSDVTTPAKRIQTNARLLPTRGALVTFTAGTVTGVLLMFFASVPQPSNAASTKISTPELTAPERDLPTSRPDSRPAAEGIRVVSAPTSRVVSTSGKQTAGLKEASRQSRAASALPARPRNTSGGPVSYRGSLAFRSAPQGARVFVNGALVGSTPLILENLPVGSRAVRIEADGYQTWSTSTQIVANRETRVSATLAPDVQ